MTDFEESQLLLTDSHPQHKRKFHENKQSAFEWKKISLKSQSSTILSDISGFSNPGEILAIIGPSGCGKTSLLSVLSNQPLPSGCEKTGEILINKKSIQNINSGKYIAYVQQENVLFDHLTPFEYLYFTLAIKSSYSEPVLKQKVLSFIDMFRLEDVKDSIMKDILGRGISGGERKRVCIAAELLKCPSILILDEPTSGLDSVLSKIVIKILKDVAECGVNVILSIHQPGNEIFNMLDRVIFMQEGKFVYQGKVCDSIDYFNAIGFKLTKHINPPEYYMKLLKINDRVNLTSSEKTTLSLLNSHYEKSEIEIWKDQKAVDSKSSLKLKKSLSLTKSIELLLWRETIYHLRHPMLIQIKVLQMIANILVINSIYYSLNYDSRGVEDRKGVLTAMLTISAMAQNYGITISISQERMIALKEIKENLYGINSYYIAKLMIEIPITAIHMLIFVFSTYYIVNLNSESPSKPFILVLILFLIGFQATVNGLLAGALSVVPVLANIMSAVFAITFNIFSGYYTNPESGPGFTKWIKYLGSQYFLRNSAYRNEFDDLEIDTFVYPKPKDRYGYEGEIYENVLISFIHISVYYFLAYLVYYYQVKKSRLLA